MSSRRLYLRAEPVHQGGEAWERGVDRRAVIDRHGLARTETQHQEGHGDAVVEMGLDQPATRRRLAVAMHGEAVGTHLMLHAVSGEARRDARQAIAFLRAPPGQA